KIILLGILFGLAVGFINAAVDVIYFTDHTFIEHLFSPTPVEIWMRSVVLILFILFSVYLSRIINKLKRAEEERKESEERYRALSDASFEGICISEKGVIVNTNLQFAEMLGYLQEELIGLEIKNLTVPEYQERVAKNIKGNYTGVYESKAIRKDGAIIDVEIHGHRANYKGRHVRQTVVRDITERKRAKAEISSIYNAISDFITVQDTEFRILSYNRAVENVWGKDLKGKLCYEAYQGRSDICPDCAVKRAIDSKKPESTSQTSTGTSPPVEIYAYPIIDDSNKVVAVVEHGRDITERMRMEDELKSIMALSKDMICTASETHFVKVSPVMEKVLGYTEEELLKIPFIELIHPDDIQPTKDLIEEKLKKGESAISFVNRYRCKDGSYRWFEWMSKPVEEGLMYGVARDITERKKAEQARRDNEEQLRSITETSPDYIMNLDREGKIIFINRPAPGLMVEDVIGTSAYDFIDDENKVIMKECVEGVLESGVQGKYVICRTSTDGQARYYESRVGPVKDPSGEVIGVTINASDITERKRAEEKIQKSESQLREAQKIAGLGFWDLNLI
ncbi:hypothetical protein LCGC14_2324870, partial [marine sediment metagenome]